MADTIESLRARLEVYEQDIDALLKERAELKEKLHECCMTAERLRLRANNKKGELAKARAAIDKLHKEYSAEISAVRRRCAERIKAARAEADEWRLAVHEVGIGAT